MPNSQIFWWEKYLETHRNTVWLLSLKLSFQELSDWGLWMRIRVLIVMLLSMPQTALRYLRCSWPVAICESLVNPWTKSLADSHFLSISHRSTISIWFIPCRFMQTWKRPLVSRIQSWIRFQKEKKEKNTRKVGSWQFFRSVFGGGFLNVYSSVGWRWKQDASCHWVFSSCMAAIPRQNGHIKPSKV